MFGVKQAVVGPHERGLLFKDKRLSAVLTPDRYRYWDPLDRLAIQLFDLNDPKFHHPYIDNLLAEYGELLDQHLDRYDLAANQLGLVHYNERLVDILLPDTRQLYWRGPVAVRVEILSIGGGERVEPALLKRLYQPRQPLVDQRLEAVMQRCQVDDYQQGLLLINGRYCETLGPGRYGFWSLDQRVEVALIDRRATHLEVTGQELMTKDRIALRLSLFATYRITDPVALRQQTNNLQGQLYLALQLALRAAVSAKSLDELLADKSQLDGVIAEAAGGWAKGHGIVIDSVGVRDIILPGEMKAILNQVLEAEKAAQANVIRRREETAAARSLLNTAKLMEESPLLLRLKELEMLEKVTEKVERLTVFGGLEGVLDDLVRIGKASKKRKGDA